MVLQLVQVYVCITACDAQLLAKIVDCLETFCQSPISIQISWDGSQEKPWPISKEGLRISLGSPSGCTRPGIHMNWGLHRAPKATCGFPVNMVAGAKRTAGVTPLRRSPASVRSLGSSQPATMPPVARRFSFRLLKTLWVKLRRPYSQTTGRYISSACRQEQLRPTWH